MVYEVTPVGGGEWVIPVTGYDRVFDGVPLARTWDPLPVELVSEDEGGPLNYSDLPWWGSDALALRAAAAEGLRGVLSPIGELLPLSCPDADLVIYNLLNLVDALDPKASSIVRFPNSERVMVIEKHVFRPDALRHQRLFKLPELRRGPLYASEAFRMVVEATALTGLTFKAVWDESAPT